jgi:hypothetical protein
VAVLLAVYFFSLTVFRLDDAVIEHLRAPKKSVNPVIAF